MIVLKNKKFSANSTTMQLNSSTDNIKSIENLKTTMKKLIEIYFGH